MGLSFFAHHGGRRTEHHEPQPELFLGAPLEEDDGPEDPVLLDYEVPAMDWAQRDPARSLPGGFVPHFWPDRPRCFVDGKDVGLTVASLRSPQGYPVPVRLSQLGSTVMREEGQELHRAADIVERAVSFVVDLFPWDEIEDLAAALQEHGMRLLPARVPRVQSPAALHDYEVMRKAAQLRSNDEMAVLEENLAALCSVDGVPTVIDGRLEPRSAGRHQRTAAIGVIKSHRQRYLHPRGMQVLYDLLPGQRTPAFVISGTFAVVSWYVRFAAATPNYGLVRIELPRGYFEKDQKKDFGYIDRLSHTLYGYRCRDDGYRRSKVSLHPIVRAEACLGALMSPMDRLMSRFYRMTGL